MRKFLIGVGVVIVLVIAAAFIVPMFIPTETYKAEIKERVRAATGREIVIKGDLKFSILPTLGLKVNDVSFANAPGATTQTMATFKQLVVKLKAIPLISGRTEIDQFELVEPVINLEVDKAGRPNWVFAKPGQAAKAPAQPKKKPSAGQKTTAAKPAPSAKSGDGGGPDLRNVKIGDVRLVKGTVTYLDRRTGARQRIDNANLTVSMAGITSPLRVKGDLTWNKEAVAIDLRLENPEAFSTGKSSPVRLSVRAQPVRLSLAGSAKGGKAVAVGGKLDVDIPSVRKLAAWTGNPIAMQGSGLGPFKLAGTLGLSEGRVALTKSAIKLDNITAKGDIVVAMTGRVPMITGKLDVPVLDLNPYVAGGGGKPAAGKPSAGSGQAPAAKSGQKPAARPARTARGGWNRQPLNTAALRTVNADLTLSAGGIRYKKIKVDRGQVRVKLNGGRLEAQLQQLKLYGGSGGGIVVLDGSGKVAKINQTFAVSKVQAQPFLRDAAGYNDLSGLGSGKLKITGAGASQYAIVQSLNGDGSFTLRNGAIRGASLVGMICAFNPAQLMKGVGKDKETKFSEFNGRYAIRKGILTVADYKNMQLKSPLMRLSAKGSSSLPARNLNFRIEPKIVGTCKGQGSGFAKKGVAVPLFLKGTWDNPRWGIDTAALLKRMGPLGKGDLKGGAKEAEKAVKGLIKGIKPGAGGKKGEKPEKPEKALKKSIEGILGGGKKKQ